MNSDPTVTTRQPGQLSVLEVFYGRPITFYPDKSTFPALCHPYALPVWESVTTSPSFKEMRRAFPHASLDGVWAAVLNRYEAECRTAGKPPYLTTTDRPALQALHLDLSYLRRKAVKELNDSQLFKSLPMLPARVVRTKIAVDSTGLNIVSEAPLKSVKITPELMNWLRAPLPSPFFRLTSSAGILKRVLPRFRYLNETIEFRLDLRFPIAPKFSIHIHTPKRPLLFASGKALTDLQVVQSVYRQLWLPLIRLHRIDGVPPSRLL